MKRIHIGLQVDDIAASTRFYSTLFGAEPSVLKDDYAKWMLDDPRVNFSISTRCDASGRMHLGLQVDSPEELAEVTGRLKQAGLGTHETPEAACCYHKSDKTWTADPEGLAWEAFFTHGATTVYGDETLEAVDIARLVAGEASESDRAGEQRPGDGGGCCAGC